MILKEVPGPRCRGVAAALGDALRDVDLDLALRPAPPRAFPVDGVFFVYFNRGNLSLKAFPGDPSAAVERALAAVHRAFVRDHRGDAVQDAAFALPDGGGWVLGKKNAKRVLLLHLDAGRYPTIHAALALVDHLKAGLLSNIRVLP